MSFGVIVSALFAIVLVAFSGPAYATPGNSGKGNHGQSGDQGNKKGHNNKGKPGNSGHKHGQGNGPSNGSNGHGQGNGNSGGHSPHGNGGGNGHQGGSGNANDHSNSDPAGNNGTIKIDDVDFDSHPNNEPHVGCVFQVDFYGFDKGDNNAIVTFAGHSPTNDGGLTVSSGQGNPSTVFIGEDDASGGGSEAGLDASETYVLAFTGEPHPKQGYHVKLTVNAPESKGSDVKHKVFWVQDCGSTNPPPPPSSSHPRGNLQAACTGKVTVVMDNAASKKAQAFYLTRTVLGPAPHGASPTLGPASQGRAFMVDPGETKTVYRHGSPGEIFELSYQGGKDKVLVPAKCKPVPPPPSPPEPPVNLPDSLGLPTSVSSGLSGSIDVIDAQAEQGDGRSLGLLLGLMALVSCTVLAGLRSRSKPDAL